MANDIIVQQVAVDPDGSLQIGYYTHQADIKANGVMHMHTICVPAGEDYDDEIAAVLDATKHLIRDVLDDLPRLSALSP